MFFTLILWTKILIYYHCLSWTVTHRSEPIGLMYEMFNNIQLEGNVSKTGILVIFPYYIFYIWKSEDETYTAQTGLPYFDCAAPIAIGSW